MLRAFWTWLPVSSGSYRAFDEPYAYKNNKWFFDKSVWQKMFRTMSDCNFNAIVLANTHPFPFIVDLKAYPDAKVIDELTLSQYQQMFRWILDTAIQYDIAPYLLFFSVYYPQKMLQSRGISLEESKFPTDFSIEYAYYCTRELLRTYPELVGLIADASENITQDREKFLQQAVVDAADVARPDIALYLRGWCADAEKFVKNIKRRGGKPVKYSVKYTWEHLVDSNPDPMFTSWVDAAGAENVAAELWISNFEPWTSFSYETAEGILENLEGQDCAGFSLLPLSLYEWPHTSDTYFKFQFQRDKVWYSVWGGSSIEDLIREGNPKWLLRNQKLISGFEAGSRIMELLSLYFAGDKQNQWHPQFCSLRNYENDYTHLFSIEDMLNLDDQQIFSGKNWWEEVTGDKVIHLAEYIKSGTPEDAYGPDELIEELNDLSELAIEAGEKGMRGASGEKELPSFARDAFCMGKLGQFYVERIRAALAHARGDNSEALEYMNRALATFREIAAVDSSHRKSFKAITGRSAAVGCWPNILNALEMEYKDALSGAFRRGINYTVHKLEGSP